VLGGGGCRGWRLGGGVRARGRQSGATGMYHLCSGMCSARISEASLGSHVRPILVAVAVDSGAGATSGRSTSQYHGGAAVRRVWIMFTSNLLCC
jgi:hypothetical protein